MAYKTVIIGCGVFLLLSLSGCKQKHIAIEDALQKIASIPEVMKLHDNIHKSKLDTKLRYQNIEQGETGEHFEFVVLEDHSTHTVTHYRFRVSREAGAIEIWHPLDSKWFTLEEWRDPNYEFD